MTAISKKNLPLLKHFVGRVAEQVGLDMTPFSFDTTRNCACYHYDTLFPLVVDFVRSRPDCSKEADFLNWLHDLVKNYEGFDELVESEVRHWYGNFSHWMDDTEGTDEEDRLRYAEAVDRCRRFWPEICREAA
ncbi:hypothetical protein [Sutterella sp.]|uniref:hypothetical protein n=1 Tax=Sutterella sp. TaxID=1981025 RepID=UPI0026DECFAF|nr:hypothetical protein [Sutterella sp.]MDO5532876.1 hypothetical protein [Sutterella sp.]